MVMIEGTASIPVLFETDVLVIGGGLAGVAAAVELAKGGKSVVLIEKQTFLGYEVGAWLRPWFTYRMAAENLMKAWLPMDEASSEQYLEDKVIPIHPDAFKRKLEDRLEEAGVDFLYMTQVMECFKQDGQYQVIVGNKSGRQAIYARCIIDTTENGMMALLLEHDAYTYANTSVCDSSNTAAAVWRTIEFTKVDREYAHTYRVNPLIGLTDKIQIIPGSFGTDHVYVEIPIPVTIEKSSCYENDIAIETSARKISIDVIEFLVHSVPAFSNAVMGLGSLRTMKQKPEDPLGRLDFGVQMGRRILALGDGSSDCLVLYQSFYDRLGLNLPPLRESVDQDTVDVKNMEHRSLSEFESGWDAIKHTTALPELPVLGRAQVLVAGGGTAGPLAAGAAAAEGVTTALLEMNSALGGTGTLGGVRYYWYGYREGFTELIDRRVEALNDRLKQPVEPYIWGNKDVWRAELKSYALLEYCLTLGVCVYTDCIVMGSMMDAERVCGVLAATPYGPAAFFGDVTLDTTGDGDVAAFAGGANVYGSERDRFGMWASMAPYNPPAQYMGNFSSTVHMGDIRDLTRFITAERRRIHLRFNGEVHDHATYVAPRESRHILGDKVITLMDQLLHKRHKDTIQLSFSNHDPKGRSMADIVYFGIIPPNLEIEIPYGALIPKGLEQLIVAGRAISCTHDALCAIRMQDDIQQQAGAAGLAAALSIHQGVSPRDLHVRVLQEKLVKMGALRPHVLNYSEQDDNQLWEEGLSTLIEGLTGNEPMEWLEMDVHDKAVLPSPIVLEKEWLKIIKECPEQFPPIPWTMEHM